VVEAKPGRLSRRLRALGPWWRTILRAALFVGPTLLLIPFGIAWLWERGWMLWWLMATTVGVFIAGWAGGLWKPDLPPIALKGARPGASPGEVEARARIARIVDEAKASDIEDANAARALAERVVHEVAVVFHPGEETPTLRVTLPELLLVTEQTANDIRRRLLTDFPILRDIRFDILESGSGLMAMSDHVMTGYRVGRFLFNPLSAIVQEVQRVGINLVGHGMAGYAKRRVAQILVAEIGEAAIRLYSGSARMDSREIKEASALDTDSGAAEASEPSQETLRAAVVGQVNAGKSSLVNALSGAARAIAGNVVHTERSLDFPLDHDAHGPLLLTDTKGLVAGGEPDVEAMVAADMLLWPVALHRADRKADTRALAALREWAAKNPRRSVPPIVFVATHPDRLEPNREWAPPYDIEKGSRPEEISARAALEAAKSALAWPEARWVPVVVGDRVPVWNLDSVRTAIVAARPAAEASRAMRLLETRGTTAKVADAVRSAQGAARKVWAEMTRGAPGGNG
jgi:predicted GTPase